jgi:hypothetical protein
MVLEGATSQGWRGSLADYLKGQMQEWQRVKPTLGSWASAFDREPLPLQYSPAVWGTVIQASLFPGDIPGQGSWLRNRFANVPLQTAESNDGLVSQLDGLKAWLRIPARQRLSTVFQAVTCQSTVGEWRENFVLKGGQLAVAGDDICAGLTYRPWNTSEYPIQSNIVYFHGTQDPVSPLALARDSFVKQKGSNRAFVSVAGTGHAPLGMSLQSLGCANQIWTSIIDAPHTLQASLQTCGWPVKMDLLSAGK